MPIGNALTVIRNYRTLVPVITSDEYVDLTYNQTGFSYFIKASNDPISFGIDSLPPNLKLNTTTGEITGIPTTILVNFTGKIASATNKSGTGRKIIYFRIMPLPPVITSPIQPIKLLQGITYTVFSVKNVSTNMNASDIPFGYYANNLPPDTSINKKTGEIYGKVTTIGTYNVGISAENVAGTGTGSIQIIVDPQTPIIVSKTSDVYTTGDTVNYTIVADNYPSSHRVENLPSWLSFDGNKTISGTIPNNISEPTNFTVYLSATNITGTGKSTYTINVIPPPVISKSNYPINLVTDGDYKYAYICGTISGPCSESAYVVQSTNMDTKFAGVAPKMYTASNLPTGLRINPSEGVIYGVPTISGTWIATVTAQNSKGKDTENFVFNVGLPAPVFTSSHIVETLPNTSIVYKMSASNLPTKYEAANMPSWLSFDGVDTLTGTTPPSSGGLSKDYYTDLSASNFFTGKLKLQIRSTEIPNITNLPTSRTGRIGERIDFLVQATNNYTIDGPIEYIWLTGVAPAGVGSIVSGNNRYWDGFYIDSAGTKGLLAFIPKKAGVYSMQVKCKNRAGTSATGVINYTIT